MTLTLLVLTTFFTACQPGVDTASDVDEPGLGATFDVDGMQTPDGDLRLTFSTWGRAGAMNPVPRSLPVREGPRATWSGPDVQEWWVERDGELEQGWVVPRRPGGAGPLVLGVTVTGAEVRTRGDTIQLQTALRTWRYGSASAVDADGRALAVELRASGDTIEVVVHDAGATYPVDVDPVLSAGSWAVEGNQSYSFLGQSASSGGDADGDGYADILVGMPGYTDGDTNEGCALLYLSGASGPDIAWDWGIESNDAGGEFGYGVDFAGDVNGDGYDEIAVGCPFCAVTRTEEGYVVIYNGRSGGPSNFAAWEYDSGLTGAYFGQSVGGGGDFDADGYDDLLVGAPGYTNGQSSEGAAFLFTGSRLGLSGSAAWSAESNSSSAQMGTLVMSVGDVDGDGYDDAAVGAPGYSGSASQQGRVYVYLGQGSGLAATATWTVEGDRASEGLGRAITAGDFDGDGYSDIAIGSEDYTSTSTGVGRVAVYPGSSSGPASTVGWELVGTTARQGVGAAVSAGDFDMDGLDDLAVGVPTTSDPEINEGSAWVFLGSGSGLGASYAQEIQDDFATAEEGRTLGRTGDVTGDGAADLVVASGFLDNGQTDEGVAFLWEGEITNADADGDGYYTGGSGDRDCDDTDSTIHPGATEVCDEVDNDCDGTTDEGLGATYHPDADGDSYGSASASLTACSQPSGYVSDATDCDDTHASAHPGAAEIDGDGIDEDCDGVEVCQRDADHDGYGTATTVTSADGDCADAGESTTTTDCDDASSAAHPGGVEVPVDGVDGNCDGVESCFADTDLDGYGSSAQVTGIDMTCTGPGEALVATDCDDANAAAYPSGTEIVGDGVDEDCDGAETCYDDDDNDGYLDATGDTRLSADSDCRDAYEGGSTDPVTDCNDGAAAVHPGATEVVADGVDTDCDGTEVCYEDADGDGFGTSALVTSADGDCRDSGEATESTDCDDANSAANPDATELEADGIDEDCDGDELCYADADADGFGATTPRASGDLDCTDAGEAIGYDDCDDTDRLAYPGAPELPGDGVDEDCDGQELCYTDADGDLFGADPTAQSADLDCLGAGQASDGTDCDDADPGRYPGADEVVADGIDESCDDLERCFVDADGDGHGGVELGSSADLTCAEAGFSAVDDDCDDAEPATFPGADEVPADGVDEDCDGLESCYVDSDGDGYGVPTIADGASLDCSGAGLAANDTDCDDASATVSPAGTEACNGVDDDCDGSTDEELSDCEEAPTDDTGGRDKTLCGCATTEGSPGAALATSIALLLALRVRRRPSELGLDV